MVCETCRGTGIVLVPVPPEKKILPPDWGEDECRLCPDCIGGISSCCDGAGSQQPERTTQTGRDPGFDAVRKIVNSAG